jgi:6-phosphofructokinase
VNECKPLVIGIPKTIDNDLLLLAGAYTRPVFSST